MLNAVQTDDYSRQLTTTMNHNINIHYVIELMKATRTFNVNFTHKSFDELKHRSKLNGNY